ncbi:unnamed protein product [marine sediment metagenome]|uniref:Antitoxin n=1 Tax=marine sediment metagenome TaxID=412755 RepID=X0VNW2_9ZZZZ
MSVTITYLRQNIYKLFDHVFETGIPLEVNKNGKKLRIVPENKPSKLSNLKKHNLFNCKPKEILNLDWSDTWEEKFI